MKKATIFVWDASKHMSPNDFKTSKEIMFSILQSKLLAQKKTDVVGLVTVGVDSQNHLNEQDSDQYKNIAVYGYSTGPTPLQMTSVDLLRYVDACEQKTEGDVVDGIMIAFDMMDQHCKHYKFTKSIYILTTPHELNPEGLDQLSGEISWTIIGFNGNGFNGNPLQDFLQLVNGTFFDGQEALLALEQLKIKQTSPVTSFRGNLTLGSLEISVWMYVKTMEAKLPTATKYSKKAEAIPEDQRDESFGGVQQERRVLYDNKELQADELIKGFKYGKNVVPLTEEDLAAAQLKTDKSLSCLGFIPLHKVRRHEYMGRIYSVAGDPKSPEAVIAFDGLMRAMNKKRVAAVVRYVRVDNAKPMMGALVCNPKGHGYFIQMPFKQDVRKYEFPEYTMKPSAIEFDDYIDALPVQFEIKQVLNPAIQHFNRCLIQRVISKEARLPEPTYPFMEQPSIPNEWTDKIQAEFKLEKRVEEKDQTSFFDKLPSYQVKTKVETITTVDPCHEFSLMFPENPTLALQLMASVIEQLSDASLGMYPKALDAILLFRSKSIEQPNEYNQLLERLATTDLYPFLVERGITFISDQESSLSTMSVDRAQQYLQKAPTQPEQDLFDLLE